jgi:serine/threonine-protein kinase
VPATDRLRAALEGHYSIEREIGAGGMATVYLARDLKHDREVALKVLRADLSAVIGSERFLAEVRITAKLDHPHILTLIDSGSADGILYYVLPFVRGESLRAKLDREKQLGVDEALSIITQVASALDYAHAKGVVHRDIKPENILLHEGEAVLTDFGIALAVKEASGNRMTETGLSLGTPQYMSPEQATGDRNLDRRSDIYSLGAVFYEMLAGEPPITGASAQAVVAKLLTERPVKLRVLRPALSPAMESATEKALAKVPADRFSSAGEFVRALSASAPQHAPAKRDGSGKWVAIAIAAVAVIAAGFWLTRLKSAVMPHTAVALRDRAQLTSTGRVSIPTVSGDGKTIAYVVTDCDTHGCRYGIEMQDLAGGAARRLLDGATSLYALQLSPDRRNVLMYGTVNHVYGSFLVSTLGGSPHYISSARAAFWSGGDSLLIIRESAPAQIFWILLSGLDGVPTDSIRIEGPGDRIADVTSVPNSRRFIYALWRSKDMEWVFSDRAGKRYSARSFPLRFLGSGQASADALWFSITSPGHRGSSILRVPFDAVSGNLGDAGDTVYTGDPTGFGVTADGGTFLVDEGTTEYAGWALSLDDALKGRFADDRRAFRGTSPLVYNLSPDGSALTLSHDWGAQNRPGGQWVLTPFGGGPETPVPGRHVNVWFVDSTMLGLQDTVAEGTQFSLLDLRTRRKSALLTMTGRPFGHSGWDFLLAGKAIRAPGAWVWISAGGRTINIQRDGTSRPREFQVPSWYAQAFDVAASPDGRSLAFVGWNAPNEDSMAVGLVTLPEGKFSRIWTTFSENGAVQWLGDGSILVHEWDTPESVTYFRLRIGGSAERLGSLPRPIASAMLSQDLRKIFVLTRDYHGDAWVSKVVR